MFVPKPIVIRSGNVAVKIYTEAHPTNKSGLTYVVCWTSSEGRQRVKFADLVKARAHAKDQAGRLDKGQIESSKFSEEERLELRAARDLADLIEPGRGVVGLLRDLQEVRNLVGPDLLTACKAWADKGGHADMLIPDAVADFLKFKEAMGVDTKAGYARTLPGFRAAFPTRTLIGLTPGDLDGYLSQFAHPVTRNTHRKRVVAMFRWARKRGLLPLDTLTAAERTDSAVEEHEQIGLITAAELAQAYALIREKAAYYLPALTLAASTGLRRAEVHGQRWEDIDLDRKILRVTVAKPNTPARRLVPITASGVAELRRHYKKEGPICSGPKGEANLSMDRVRDICRTANLDLADNGFRHSWISARVALTGHVHETSLEAGNSPAIIHQHYRELMRKDEATAWFDQPTVT